MVAYSHTWLSSNGTAAEAWEGWDQVRGNNFIARSLSFLCFLYTAEELEAACLTVQLSQFASCLRPCGWDQTSLLNLLNLATVDMHEVRSWGVQ